MAQEWDQCTTMTSTVYLEVNDEMDESQFMSLAGPVFGKLWLSIGYVDIDIPDTRANTSEAGADIYSQRCRVWNGECCYR